MRKKFNEFLIICENTFGGDSDKLFRLFSEILRCAKSSASSPSTAVPNRVDRADNNQGSRVSPLGPTGTKFIKKER